MAYFVWLAVGLEGMQRKVRYRNQNRFCLDFSILFLDLAKNAELMWQQSVCSSLITASIAAHHLKEGGVVQLTGAKAALEGTPGSFID